ncbi:dynactin 2 [Blastomyces parvus]|uniref:Dynactin 2 n=1 Tax=Blastomyces parvus TaxID=2060905 RepID=A0A2B7XK93_9EURO|nr:dynactin 2 [Blastomyces parvus]
MAFNKKYAGLPDLDVAPDIYETPELTDGSTLATATVRSPSPFQDESTSPEIDRQRLQPDQARSHFLSSRLDARGVDFSDSIASKRTSYKAMSRRRQRREDGTEILGDVSDEEDESLERKLARLRREAEELKEALATRNAAQRDTQSAAGAGDSAEGDHQQHQDDLDNGLLELSRALDNLHTSSRGGAGPMTAEEILSQKLGGSIPPTVHAAKQRNELLHGPQSNIPAGLLSNAAAFDARLTLLEAALGIPNTPIPHSADDATGPQPILPALSHLTVQLSTLSSTLTGPSASIPGPQSQSQPSTVTTPHIEALTTRIRKLTADADALSSARRRATEAARAVIAARIAAATSDDPAGTTTTTTATATGHIPASTIPDHHAPGAPSLSSLSAAETDSAASEQAAKIQALYTTLPTITSLHPLLPSVLERLRSLRAIHAGAARAAEDLDALEEKQAEMKREIEQWRGGLAVVEGKVRECEGAMRGNMEVVGPWVKGLEGRLEGLGG